MNSLTKRIKQEIKAYSWRRTGGAKKVKPEPADVFLKDGMYRAYTGELTFSSLPKGHHRKRKERAGLPGRHV